MNRKQTAGKKMNLSGLLSTVVLMLFGGALGIFGAMTIDQLSGGDDQLFFIYLAVMLAGLLFAWFVQIVVHESGHLLFGLMSGYKFVSFNVLGFVWHRDDQGKLRVGRIQIAGAGGQCLMAPPVYNGGDFPFTLYNLGGVLINLITAALCALLAWLIPSAPVRILLMMQTLVGVGFAILNGLPIPVAAIQNDGKNLLCIRRDAHARRAFWVQMSLAAALSEGQRLKDLPEDWFAAFPEETLDNPIISAVAVLNTNRLMDKLDLAAAEAEIRTLLARKKGVLGLYRMTLSCDGAVCELIAHRPGSITEQLASPENQQLMKAMKSHPSILRTQYALALLQDKDAARAEKLLAGFEKAAQKHPSQAEIIGERELIKAIQAAAEV